MRAPGPLRRSLAVLLLGAGLSLTACSGSPAPDAAPTTDGPTAPTSAPATPAGPPSAAPSSAGGLATLPADRCLTGRYTLVRFVAVGDGSTYGTGQGGDVTLGFDGGRYTLTGAGREPVVVTLAGQTGDLRVDGSSTGGYTLDGATATFTPGSTTGGGTLDDGRGGSRTRLTMAQVDGVIGLTGDGQVQCTDQVMTITLAAVRLELARA